MIKANARMNKNIFAQKGGEESMKACVVQGMVAVRAAAVRNAPEDFGQLKNSIMWAKGWDSDTFGFPKDGGFNEAGSGKLATEKIEAPNGLEGYVGSALEYATYQEFGTRYMAANPFMRTAGDEVRGFSAERIGRKWGLAAMEKEFAQRKKEFRNL